MINTKDNWKVFAQDEPWRMSKAIYLIHDGNRKEIASIEKGNLVMTEVKEGAVNPEPTFRLPWEVWEAIKEVLIDTKVREKGEVEAELKATLYHLEDMRLLAGVKSNILKSK
jgi:hypothetical protein